MVHIVKIYFEDSKHEKQIRRLAVSSDVLSNFKFLLQKIQNVFQFETNNLEIKWKDPENDFIHMSTDDELAQALANADEGLLRLYVFLKRDGSKDDFDKTNASGDSNEPEAASEAVLHPYVTCDGCDKKIFGIRYKCLECRDFDLCSSCNLSKMHSFHDMVKFVKPTYVPREWVFTGARRLWKSMFNRCPGNYFQILLREKDGDPQNKEVSQSSSSDESHAQPASDPSKDDMETDAASTSNNNNSSDSKEKNSKQMPKDDPNLYSDPSKWPGVFLECLNGDFVEAQKLIHNGLGQILKNVQVKVDSPLFKSEFNVDKSEKEKQKSRPADEKTEKKTRQEEAKAEEKTEHSKPKTPSFHTQNPFLSKDQTQSAETAQAKSNEADMAKSNTDTKNVASGSIQSPTVEITIESVKSSNNVNEDTMSGECWTFLNNDETSQMECGAQEANAENVTPEKVVTYPDLMEFEQEINLNTPNNNNTQTKDPIILSALTTMQSMGFTNEGGWLEKLLISKQGNINETLDALYPGAHHQ